jgi:hypothetical protein
MGRYLKHQPTGEAISHYDLVASQSNSEQVFERLFHPDDTVMGPAFGLEGKSLTGIHKTADDELGIRFEDVTKITISSTGVTLDDGITLGGNLVMGDNDITGVDDITFTDTAGQIAGIQNGNLLDKSATESVTGAYTFTTGITVGGDIVMGDNSITGVDTITFTDTAGTIAGIANVNLLDKSTTETVSAAWTFSAGATFNNPIVMSDPHGS